MKQIDRPMRPLDYAMGAFVVLALIAALILSGCSMTIDRRPRSAADERFMRLLECSPVPGTSQNRRPCERRRPWK